MKYKYKICLILKWPTADNKIISTLYFQDRFLKMTRPSRYTIQVSRSTLFRTTFGLIVL